MYRMNTSETSFTANHFTIRQHSDLSTDHVTQLNTVTTNNNTAATQTVYRVKMYNKCITPMNEMIRRTLAS